jgi:hypothetical protein
MNAKKEIDKSDPKYNEYISKCKKLWDKYQIKIDAEIAKYPNWKIGMGLDHPASVATHDMEVQRNAELKKLQKEYAFLFVEVNTDE